MHKVWERADFDIDVAQGKNLADASKYADVQHLIWSSLPNVMSSVYIYYFYRFLRP
jgi:hypothetical protein